MYHVQEFANLSGVTIRTLHCYDKSGLLKPARRKGVRLYEQKDLLRLQQILTLKYMGFSLGEIRELLTSPTYDVKESLRIQKQAVEDRIRQLQGVAFALEHTLKTLETAEQANWDDVIAIIQGVTVEGKQQWARQYFTDEQWHHLQQ
jgi:MerR family transcriptional regulator, thiopeptide resistance regulator